MSSKNVLINGNFDIWQRGTSFTSATSHANNDDTYLVDRWILLSDGNDIVDVSQESTDVPEGSFLTLKSDVQTASKQFGYLQIVEQYNCNWLRGDVVSLSFQAQSSGIANIRAAVLSSTNAANSPTSDAVSSWADVPTLGNWEYLAVSPKLPVTGNYYRYMLEDVHIPSDAKNVSVFIWIVDTDAAVNDTLHLSQVQLEKGASATEFDHRQAGEEVVLCRRYYQQFPGTGTTNPVLANAFVETSSNFKVQRSLPVAMRQAPTFDSNGAGNFTVLIGGSTYSPSAIALDESSSEFISLDFTLASHGATVGLAGQVYTTSAAGFMYISSEL